MSYLDKKYDWQAAALTDVYDELPLWSAMPGQLLLENIPFYLRPQTVVDLGCGTGFPLLLLARRLGPSVQVIGVDPWQAAMDRAAQKCNAWGLGNVTLLRQAATQIDLPDQSVDLITSNLGLNNFGDVVAVLGECKRLLKPQGRLCLSTNLRGTFAEFYEAFQAVADDALQSKIRAHAQQRHDTETLQGMFAAQGFETKHIVEDGFTMTYADGTAFLNDYFIGMGFLQDWKALVPADQMQAVFGVVEVRLNELAADEGELRLTIPIACLELQPI